MRTKTLLTSFLLFGLSFTCFAQNTLDNLMFETEYKYGTYIVKLSYGNLYKGLLMNNQKFETILNNLSYSFNTEDNTYIANTTVGAPYYLIKKTPGDLQMIWTDDRQFASRLKDQIQSIYSKQQDEWYIYSAYDQNDRNFIITIMLNESSGGSGMVVIKRRRMYSN